MNLNECQVANAQFTTQERVGEPNHVIEGEHCLVKCYRISEKHNSNTWHFSPSFTIVGRLPPNLSSSFNHTDILSCYLFQEKLSTYSAEEQIANSISLLPNVDYLVNINSFDQVKNWVTYRDKAVDLALSFWADDEPRYLKQMLEREEIDEFSYKYSLAEAKIYKGLWRLIQANEAIIQKNLILNCGFPFDSSRAFFVEIVREVLEEEFLNCFKRRYIYNASQMNRIAKLKRRMHQGRISKTEENELYRLIDRLVPFATWLNRVLVVADYLRNSNRLTHEEYLDKYREGLYELATLQVQRDCKPEYRAKHYQESRKWERGQTIKGRLT